jgi:flagellin-specific chaperone FliS
MSFETQVRQEEKPVAVAGEIRPKPQYSTAVNAYRREQFLNLSPVEVILKLYDTAILGIKKNDNDLAKRAINELIAALNFDYQDISVRLFGLYQYSKRCLRENKPQDAIVVLEELRGTWAQAFNL